MSRSICANALYRYNLVRSLSNIQFQANSAYGAKPFQFYCPSSRVSQYQPDLYTRESPFKSNHVSYSSSTSPDNQSKNSVPASPSGSDLPSPEQLQNIENKLSQFIKLFLVSSPDVPINGKTIVCINNLSGKNKTYKGVLSFTIQKLLLRLYAHFNYLSVNVEVINSSTNIADGTVTIDWKLSYISNLQYIKTFMLKNRLEIYGICTAKVKNDGLIHTLYLERRKVMNSEPAAVS
ncbi:hypothetical protein LOTGIDRAFT_172465 [Lottia gigantea]|uniref:Uncharacterized protein n=1 Tax=Lottia gigantea TaxID=225164 RepID=V4ACH5_LOTGI|nr:hypothetical protein LOTGIDRAFT_172465 [Lottia gigantea]ESP01709.1 hypothetical protein LOTGIDRAFT_172465 [Lottia gigantea]